MKSKSTLLILLCIIFALGSCVTTRDTNFLQDISKEYPKVDEPEYRVIVGDKLEVIIYTMNPEMLRDVLGSFADGGLLNIRADGTVKVPYLGKIHVEGLTLYEIGKLLSEKFGTITEGTTASVRLDNMYYTLLGEMGSQRVVMDKPVMTIFEVLSKSTSINLNGNRKKVTILRQTRDGAMHKEFDLRSKDIVDSDFYYIQPNDVIYVPRSNREFLGGNGSTIGGVIGVVGGLITVIVVLVRLF